MDLIQSFIAIPEAAAKRQAGQLNANSNLEAQQELEKLEGETLCWKPRKKLESKAEGRRVAVFN